MKANTDHINRGIAIAAVVISVIFTACNGSHEGHDHGDEAHDHEEAGHTEHIELTPAQVKEAGIALGTFEYRSLNEYIPCNGNIELPPNNIASISVPMEGFVEEILFLEGARVKKGETVVELKHPSYVQLQQDYLEASSRLDFLSKELARQQTLSEAQVSAKKTLQQTEADHSSIKAKVSGLAEQLRYLGISTESVKKGNITSSVFLKAPFNGTVTQLNAHRGQLVGPQQVIMEVIDTEHMHVELMVFQRDIPNVKEGMQIEFTIPAYENKHVYVGAVSLVGKNLDQETKTIRVHGHFEESPELIPGLYVEANILGKNEKQKVLSEKATFRDEGSWWFFVRSEAEGEHLVFEKVKFTPGITANGFTEILEHEAISDTMAIVIDNAFYLKSEMNKSEGGHQH